MKRPQSAKPGHRGLPVQSSSDDIREDDGFSRNNHRKQLKLMKPQLTTNDYARVRPKNIHQDKQRLYSETLQLKQSLNEISEENIRLKTRISILEKEKDKMNKYLQSATESSNKTQSRLNLYAVQNKSADKQNMMVRNLKKMIRDSKDQNQYLKQQNIKIKKAIKYTRINELQIERKILQQQNQKLNRVLQEIHEQLSDQEQYERQVNELKSYLEDQVEANKQLSESNQKYIEYIDQLEEKLTKEIERGHEKQKKLQRDLGLQKRKLAESIKVADELRRQIKTLRENNNNTIVKKQTQKFQNRPISSNPYKQRATIDNKKEIDEVKQKNGKLEKQLQQAKAQLQKSETRLRERQERKNTEISKKELKLESEPKFDESNEQQNNQQFILAQDKKVQRKQDSADEYADEFQEEESKKVQNNELQQYKKDFEEQSEEAEHLYQKKGKSKKQKEKSKGKYKPNKSLMSQIKQLLTYRMKAQRYPYEQLEKDILSSNQTQFIFVDLENMMKVQPFYLTPKYTTAFLQYAFEKDSISQANQTISSQNFLKKIRKLIEDFQLPEEQEEEEMLLRIAQMTTTYPNQLQIAFEKIKNGPETVCKEKLIEMFKKLQLEDKYIEVIISQLSLCSDDLQHLNYHGFFQRFYIENSTDRQPAIDQEQIESSGQEKGRTPHYKYEEDKVNFVMDDEGDQSMGLQKNNNKEDNQVFDDDHI